MSQIPHHKKLVARRQHAKKREKDDRKLLNVFSFSFSHREHWQASSSSEHEHENENSS